jgi:hypothetical protein
MSRLEHGDHRAVPMPCQRHRVEATEPNGPATLEALVGMKLGIDLIS